MLYEQSPIFTSGLAKTASYENCIREAEESADSCHAELSIYLPEAELEQGSEVCHQEEIRKKNECLKCKSSTAGCF